MNKIWVSFVLWKKAEVREGWVEKKKKKSYGMRERKKRDFGGYRVWAPS